MARLGVLGWPVGHSRSPAMQNAALAAVGLGEWRYQHLPVPPELFDVTTRALSDAGLVGANVTIPHKAAALALADSATPAAREIGAANTLTFSADGAIAAENTDAPGLLRALGISHRGLTALVLGAGGSARAVVWALQGAGAREVMVHNRTPERARRLADALGARAVSRPQPADILVNCTSVGLGNSSNRADSLKDLDLERDELAGYSRVIDLVYGSEPTALLSAALCAGAAVVDGLEVLVQQGALSFELWTGRPAPIATMRQAASSPGPAALRSP